MTEIIKVATVILATPLFILGFQIESTLNGRPFLLLEMIGQELGIWQVKEGIRQ